MDKWWWNKLEGKLNCVGFSNEVLLKHCRILYLKKTLTFIVDLLLDNKHLVHRNVARRRGVAKYPPPLPPKVFANVLVLARVLVVIYLPIRSGHWKIGNGCFPVYLKNSFVVFPVLTRKQWTDSRASRLSVSITIKSPRRKKSGNPLTRRHMIPSQDNLLGR